MVTSHSHIDRLYLAGNNFIGQVPLVFAVIINPPKLLFSHNISFGPAPWDLIRLDLSDIGYIPFHLCNICGIFIYFSLVLYSSLFYIFCLANKELSLLSELILLFLVPKVIVFLVIIVIEQTETVLISKCMTVHGCYCFFSYLCRVALKINQIDWSKYFESIAHSHCSPLSIHVQMVDFLKRDFYVVLYVLAIVDC